MWESVRGRACERVRERSEKESASEGVRKQCRELLRTQIVSIRGRDTGNNNCRT